MRRSRKTVAAAAALALLVAAGGCGGSSDSSSSTATAPSSQQPAPEQPQQGKQRSGRESEKAQPKRTQQQPQGKAGGTAEFRVPGGDNSIQEFGAEASGTELEEAGAALHGFLDARVAGEWAKACTYLTKPTIESFEQLAARSKQKLHGCGAIMGALTEGLPQGNLEEAAQAEVGALRFEGDRGFLLYHGAADTDYAIPVAKEGGAWKVGALGGTPLS